MTSSSPLGYRSVDDGAFVTPLGARPATHGVRWLSLGVGALVVLLSVVPGVGGVTVGGVPTGPSVTIQATPAAGPAPLTVELAATGTNGTPPYTFLWGFGDGGANASGAVVTHTYATPGRYTATVALTDAYGASAGASELVAVSPPPLSLAGTAVPATVSVGVVTLLETSVQGGVAPYTYNWSGLPPGCPSAAVENYSCEPTASGNYSILVRVTDAVGTEANATIRLTVLGAPAPKTPATPSPGGLDETTAIGLGVLALGAGGAGLWIGRRARRRRDGPR